MFTGLIETLGRLTKVDRRGDNLIFRVQLESPWDDLTLGESIALDGYCQTVTAFDASWFEVMVSPETMAHTTAGERRVGDLLNLERALRLGDRLGGHLVAGHVDDAGTVRSIREQNDFVELALRVPPSVLAYCVPKGSLAVDGISLTINTVDDDGVSLGIIPHTWNNTTLHLRKVGDRLNLEADMIGKYIERFLARRSGTVPEKSGGLSESFLAEHGFTK